MHSVVLVKVQQREGKKVMKLALSASRRETCKQQPRRARPLRARSDVMWQALFLDLVEPNRSADVSQLSPPRGGKDWRRRQRFLHRAIDDGGQEK